VEQRPLVGLPPFETSTVTAGPSQKHADSRPVDSNRASHARSLHAVSIPVGLSFEALQVILEEIGKQSRQSGR